MKRIAIYIFYFISILFGGLLTSCGPSEAVITSEPISYTETDIQNASSCWLGTFNTSFGDWVGDGQCTALARLLTDAPSYGKGADKNHLGGIDYVIQQQNRGIHIPLLIEVKNNLRPCDNLILVGARYASAGHTVVVFYSDIENDKIYYLDQNYDGQGISLRWLSITENENNAYVIAAQCKKPVVQNCFSILSAANQETPPSINGEVEYSTEQRIPTFANEMIAYVTLDYSIESNLIIPVTELHIMDLSNEKNYCLTCKIPGHFPIAMSTDWYGSGLNPAWSPDHSMITFTMVRLEDGILDLYEADSGGNVKFLRTWKPNGMPYLFWSPDSQKIALQDINNEGWISLYIIDVESGTEQYLPLPGLSYEIEFPPLWKGNQISFMSKGNFYYINLKDAEPTLLSNLAFEIPNDVNVSPSWSPTGDKLLIFGSPGEINDAGGNSYHGAETGLYLLERDGNIIQSKLRVGNEDPIFPSWSPDGLKIAFSVMTNIQYDDDIYYIDLKTNSLTQLTSSPEQEYVPTWSPGGDKIAFVKGGSLVIMNIDGTNEEVLITENIFFLYWR